MIQEIYFDKQETDLWLAGFIESTPRTTCTVYTIVSINRLLQRHPGAEVTHFRIYANPKGVNIIVWGANKSCITLDFTLSGFINDN